MKNILYYFAAVCIFFTSCQNGTLENKGNKIGDTMASTRGGTENICIASWNAQLLDVGDLFGSPQCEGAECDARAVALCEQVSTLLDPAPDIINFQEVFEADAAEALITCMNSNGYLFNTGFDANQEDSDCFFLSGSEAEGSGLITFSKFPIIDTTTEDFEDCNGCIGDANDCYAEKGMMLTEIEVAQDCSIFNFNTHLDAGSSEGDMEARKKQLEQMKKFLERNVPGGAPLMLSGDFNIKRNTMEYNLLTSILGDAQNTAAMAGTRDGITSPGKDGKAGTTLDYIFGQNINSATYNVYFQETECWWEYREEITTFMGDDPKEVGDIDFWDLDPNNIIDMNANPTFVVSYATHRYWNEEDIPTEHLDKVVKICKNVEKSKEQVEETCGWFLTVSISVIVDDFQDDGVLIDIVNFSTDINDIPEELRQYYTYNCTPITAVNQSDHNPILSCVEFDCYDNTSNNDESDTGIGEDTCEPKCPAGSKCIQGECVYF